MRLYIAVSDPIILLALDGIKFATGTNTEVIQVEEDRFAKVIKNSLEKMGSGLGDMDEDDDLKILEITDKGPADAGDVILDIVAGWYEQEVDDAVGAFVSLLEPMIMAFLGVIIGRMVIGMYLPIFKMGAVV